MDFVGILGEAEEAFLGGVFGFGDVFEDAEAGGVDHVAIGGDEGGEGGGVARLGVELEDFEVLGHGGSMGRVKVKKRKGGCLQYRRSGGWDFAGFFIFRG